jgi:probable addiction module antidote protein
MAKSRTYDETLKETLSDPEEAAAYLSAALEEGDPAVFLLALKDVANVHGGIARVAQAAKLNRESLYRMLSENGNPTVNSLNALLHTLGLRLAIMPDKSRASRAAR